MKKAFIKRALLVLTATVISTSMLACAKQDKMENAATKNTNEITKPTTINAMLDTTFLTPEKGQAQLLEEFKKQTGIELKVNQPAHNQYNEKVSLMFASNDLPDIMEMNSSLMASFGANGALYDMTKVVENSSVLKTVDKKFKDALKVDGKLYGFPINAGNGPITYIRKDWLDKNNLKVPTNYDEFIKVLKVFANDPDGNGKQDTIAYTAPGIITTDSALPADSYVREFFQDASPNYIQKNGKWVDGMLEPEMKAALQRLKDAHSAGLLDKEIITNKTSTCQDKFNAGKVGVFTYWAGDWNAQLEDNLKKSVADGSVLAMPAISGVKYIERAPIALAIPSKNKNPEGIFKYFIEYMHDNGKGELLFSRGVEGVHYKSADGKYERLPDLSNKAVPFAKAFIGPGLHVNTGFKDIFELDSRAVNSFKEFNANSTMVPLLPPSEAYNSKSTDVINSRAEIISKITLGQLSIEDGLKKYENDTKAFTADILKDFNKTK